MRLIFADAFYWIALANPRDEWHSAAMRIGQTLGPHRLYTTDEVLVEFLAFFSGFGAPMRTTVAQLVRDILAQPQIVVLPQSRDTLLEGLQLYETRPDKQYSLTDCISMAAMRRLGLQEVLTHDDHFRQEGFLILLTDKTS